MTATDYIARINASGAGRYEFVRWAEPFRNRSSKVVCRCVHDGFEWSVTINNLIWNNSGCPQCGGTSKKTPEYYIKRINQKPNVIFIQWDGEFKNNNSKAICRCEIDGYEWSARANDLVNRGDGCPQCNGVRRWTACERVKQINEIQNITFVRWDTAFKNKRSKAVCRCDVDGYEWPASVDSILNNGSGCPRCADCGYNPSKRGTLYALRSECGTMVKIGISNDHKRRHLELARATPFRFECVELCHGDGSLIATLEKVLHDLMKPVNFDRPFDGSTEWREWDDRLPMWFEMYRSWS